MTFQALTLANRGMLTFTCVRRVVACLCAMEEETQLPTFSCALAPASPRD